MKTYHIEGQVVARSDRQGVPGLRVEVWDDDLLFDDLVGSALTDADGRFRITFDETYFRELFLDRRPDLYFRVLNAGEVVHDTRGRVVWNPERQDDLVVLELDEAPPLVLREEDLAENMAAMYAELDRDGDLRERFVRNPSGIVAERVVRRKIPPQRESEANRLLFAVLANDRMRKWLDDYAVQNAGREVPRAAFTRDFARAVVEIGDDDIVASLVANAGRGYGIPGFTDVATQIVINNAAGTAVATPVNQHQEAKSSSNFNSNTSNRPGGAVFDPRVILAVTDHLALRARELKEAGALRDLDATIR